jgi:hypothetical protein
VLAPPLIVAGAHVNPTRLTAAAGGFTETYADFVPPFRPAEIVTGVDTVTLPAVAMNVAVPEPAAIWMAAGTVKALEDEERVIVVAEAAADASITLQVSVPSDATDEEAQANTESDAGGAVAEVAAEDEAAIETVADLRMLYQSTVTATLVVEETEPAWMPTVTD